MCTYLTATAAIDGSGKAGDRWMNLGRAVVYFDHPQHVFELPFSPEARRKIMGGNAARFFRLDA